jgi:threonine synthase
MDISKASNFERFVFDLLGRDAAKVRYLFAEELVAKGRFELGTEDMRRARDGHGLVSGRSTHADRLAKIRDTWERLGVMVDTQTADGLKVARRHLDPGVPMLVLETALPVKFAATIVEALGREPDRPAGYEGIEQLPEDDRHHQTTKCSCGVNHAEYGRGEPSGHVRTGSPYRRLTPVAEELCESQRRSNRDRIAECRQ